MGFSAPHICPLEGVLPAVPESVRAGRRKSAPPRFSLILKNFTNLSSYPGKIHVFNPRLALIPYFLWLSSSAPAVFVVSSTGNLWVSPLRTFATAPHICHRSAQAFQKRPASRLPNPEPNQAPAETPGLFRARTTPSGAPAPVAVGCTSAQSQHLQPEPSSLRS